MPGRNKICFLSYIKDPFSIISKHKEEFSLWLIFTILAGQLGIISNIIIRSVSGKSTILQSIKMDFLAGNFYTFAIATCGATLGPIFITFIKNRTVKFSSLKVFFIAILIFFLFLSGIIYSASQLNKTEVYFDTLQFFIYILSIFFSIYGYCLLKLGSDPNDKDLNHLDSTELYNQMDDNKVKKLNEQEKNTTDDGNGISL